MRPRRAENDSRRLGSAKRVPRYFRRFPTLPAERRLCEVAQIFAEPSDRVAGTFAVGPIYRPADGRAVERRGRENLVDAGLDVAFLFDGSGGWGKTPESWRAAEGRACGYAGGLNPENLEAAIPQIKAAAGDARVYLDLESGARDADNRFDLAKVERILEIVAPHIDA